jgi:uncharacterized membrane protein YkvA (DUF1232 family)
MPLIRVKQLLPIMARVWDDPRVPFMARVFFVLAPIYLLFPYDIHPDFLPGGLTDDLSIMPLLIGIAMLLIPAKVFKDARRTAATQAVCGMLCLSFAAGDLVPAKVNRSIRTSDRKDVLAVHMRNGCASQFSADKRVQLSVLVGQERLPRPIEPSNVTLKQAQCANSVHFTISDTILTKRGGQYQLYAAEASTVASKVASTYLKSMPPRFAGGIFVDNSIKFLSRTGRPC